MCIQIFCTTFYTIPAYSHHLRNLISNRDNETILLLIPLCCTIPPLWVNIFHMPAVILLSSITALNISFPIPFDLQITDIISSIVAIIKAHSK